MSLADVARRAGTSHSAASRALNGRPGVRPDLREAVVAAAAELGYVPNTAARNLVMQRTGLVALAFADPQILVGTRFFADLVANVVARLDDSDYRTVLLLPSAQRERTLGDVVRPGAFDGAVVVGHRQGDGLLELFVSSGIPTVSLGRPLADLPVSFVDVDNVAASTLAMEHLLSQGSTHPGLLSCAPTTAWGQDRVKGFDRAMAQAGDNHVDGTVQECDFSSDGGYAGTLGLLERAPDTDAIIVTSATLLPGVLQAVRDTGREIPRDIMLVAFDDEPYMAEGTPSITAVSQPMARLGTEMARIAVESIANPGNLTRAHLATELIIRDSSTPSRVPATAR